MYNRPSVIVCSQKLTFIGVIFGFLSIIAVALIIAFSKPGCPEAIYRGEPTSTFDKERRLRESKYNLATTGAKFPWTKLRLPTFVHPLYYNIYLHPNVTTEVLKGNATIAISALEETDFIVLHSKGLNISFYSLQDKHMERIKIEKFLVNIYRQQIYLGLARILHRGSNYTLDFVFETSFKGDHDGILYSGFEDSEGRSRRFLYSHFEPTGARSTFPCFDEPQMKAKFQLSIAREEDQLSLFNVPKIRSTSLEYEKQIVDEYDVTPVMSCYLVSFVICDLDNVSDHTRNGVPLSVFYPPIRGYGASDLTHYILQTSIEILEYYQEFLGIPFPLPKLDLVAVRDFQDGHRIGPWGLTPTREYLIMLEPEETPAATLLEVVLTMAHELAHQWAGSLVSMIWWPDSWLSEGLANFLGHKAVAITQPEWISEDNFALDFVQPALAMDSFISSQPLAAPVADPTDILIILDHASVTKGSALLGMFEECIGGPDVLGDGLRNYMTKHRYGNALSEDFWNAFSRDVAPEINFNVEEVMSSWTRQAGFPLISVQRFGDSVFVNQSRFIANLDIDEVNVTINSSLEQKWAIPLTYVTNEDSQNKTLVWMNYTDVELFIPESVEWIKFNVRQRGLYRVDYDDELWQVLTETMMKDHLSMSSGDRASIIDDAFSLARSGHVDLELALDLSLYLSEEFSYAPWHTALSHFRDWTRLLSGHKSHELMVTFVAQLTKPIYARFGWNETGSHSERLLQSKVLEVVVNSRNNEAIDKARSLFSRWKNEGNPVPPNLRYVVYTTGITYGMKEDWDFCYNKMNNPGTTPTERNLLLSALARTHDPWILQFLLEDIMDGLNSEDMATVLTEISRTPVGQLAAWRCLRRNWASINPGFGRDIMSLEAVIKTVTSHLYREYDLEEAESFLEEALKGRAKTAFTQAVEGIRLNIKWRLKNLQRVTDWLSSKVKI